MLGFLIWCKFSSVSFCAVSFLKAIRIGWSSKLLFWSQLNSAWRNKIWFIHFTSRVGMDQSISISWPRPTVTRHFLPWMDHDRSSGYHFSVTVTCERSAGHGLIIPIKHIFFFFKKFKNKEEEKMKKWKNERRNWENNVKNSILC